MCVLAVLLLAAFNEKPAAQTPPAGQAAASQGKRPPQAKTQPEFDAYKVAVSSTDPEGQEKAADDFATKFPDSDLRALIYKSAMHGYQQANNGTKMTEMARKILGYDADDPEALLGVAQVLAERTRDIDVDGISALPKLAKMRSALVTVDTDVPASGYSPEQLSAYKGFLRSDAYTILGTIDFVYKAWADAEANLKKSIDAYPEQPDPIAVFRLSVALDTQYKYPEALKYANWAVELTKAGTNAGDAARNEQDRLLKFTNGSAAPKN